MKLFAVGQVQVNSKDYVAIEVKIETFSMIKIAR